MLRLFLNIKFILLAWTLSLLQSSSSAQSDPILRFHTDSIRLGEPVWVSLSFVHTPELEFIFPDSSYDFSPFEFVKRSYFHTKTDSLSVDSVVYQLAVYDVEATYKLSLPAIVFDQSDTTYTFSNEAYIPFKEVVNTEENAKKGLLLDLEATPMHFAFDIIFFGILLGILLIVSLLVFVFFRKRIIAWYKIRKLNIHYRAFEEAYNKLEPLVLMQRDVQAAEEFVKTWKIFLEKTDTKPFSTMTTKEITAEFGILQLTSALQNFDRAIYGARMVENLQNSMEYLKQGAYQRYVEYKNKLQYERN